MVSVTSARPSAGLADVPAKTTSSILPPRSGLTPCWPITQVNASTTFDLPDPLGPTTQVIPGSNRSVVAEANDLNPRSVRVFRYTACYSSPDSARFHRTLPCAAQQIGQPADDVAEAVRICPHCRGAFTAAGSLLSLLTNGHQLKARAPNRGSALADCPFTAFRRVRTLSNRYNTYQSVKL